MKNNSEVIEVSVPTSMYMITCGECYHMYIVSAVFKDSASRTFRIMEQEKVMYCPYCGHEENVYNGD
jgi:hypothetical protein